ncbi:MAG: UvrD-helicase domain-containing protein, partial [Vicinamibacterales bacterium]
MSETSDAAARLHAVDPSRNVVLEASAGTGKTRVLVERYVNLLRAGVEPDHILAITFTRKAAAEMRERIIDRLREAARLSQFDAGRWRELKERLGEIAISTIDAFCLSLLREFPLESDVDPGFDLADDTEVPRLINESLDRALRICRGVARVDDDVALVFAQLGERRLRTGLSALLDRRLVAPQALRRYLSKGPRDLTAADVCRRCAARLSDALGRVTGGLDAFLADGPTAEPSFAMLADDVRRLCEDVSESFERREAQADFRVLADRLRGYFMKTDGQPREGAFAGTGYTAADCSSDVSWKRHRVAAAAVAPVVADALRAFRRDLNVVLSRGVWRIFAVTLAEYHQTLDSRSLLDFSGVLERAVKLLKDMDEFAQSRFRLEARYRHVLVDEFQDTSRAQWQLVAQLVRNWGEGFGAAADAIQPTIFIVGDRKQSIYGFRDADVSVLDEAAGFVAGLRDSDDPRRAISVSFRSTPRILAFVNAVFTAMDKAADRVDRFRYEETDRFPIEAAPEPQPLLSHTAIQAGLPWDEEGDLEAVEAESDAPRVDAEPCLGIVVGESISEAAERVAAEVASLIGCATVRDRTSGMRRLARPSDIAVLMRSRDTHREFEKALEQQGVSTYVYKGLGFFDADEIQDAVALLRFLADPQSNVRAATLLRSRLVRLTDRGLAILSPALATAIASVDVPAAFEQLSLEDQRVLQRLRNSVPRWLAWVDRLTPSDLLGRLLSETAYGAETGGPRNRQARENLKKLRAMIRRFQNRGYATLSRVASHIERLAVGDESNAAIDAHDAVSLMTVHAAKGLEFPIVFVVNMNRGTGTGRAPIRVVADLKGEASVAIADYQSEADEDAGARDKEETKRVLYVALTRARDRLYLSATVTNGAF